MSDCDRIAKAIAYITERTTDQPSLEAIAAHVHLSPFHFQRLFCRWAGTTPKRFLQVLTLERGKQLLHEAGSLLNVSNALGLSSSSRLHDHFVQLEAVTPGEYKNKGKNLTIEYGVHPTPFGRLFVAVSSRGICRASFLDVDHDVEQQLVKLKNTWPLASFSRNDETTGAVVSTMFDKAKVTDRPLSLHIPGTNFQIAVWKALLQIPPGTVVSYSQLAAALGHPQSSRAIGSAIAANPVAFLIPCHRVIQQSGALGGYRWGPARKHAIQLWERAQISSTTT